MKKVAAVVVTFNRKELLRKNIEALMKQKYKDFDVFIIDNASTDGTKEYIEEYIKNNQIYYENTKINLGGAGGFNYGIKKVTYLGYEYIWIMDDDTIPYDSSLYELMDTDKILKGNYGFLSSSVLWTDGTPCKMNRQKVVNDWYFDSQYLKHGLLRTYYATFVSFFIRAEIVKEQGLPIKEFFIWGDDVEYTNRIAKKHKCYIVGKSQVMHETVNNEGSNIAKDNNDRINRYKYAYRNEMYIAKKNGIKGILRQIAKMFLHIFRVIVYSKGFKLRKIGIIILNSFKGIFFNPKIEYININ